jgi:hypothetical protein
MTETETTVRPPATIGQAVGIAETELTRLLAGVLAETGTPRETYLAMQRLSFLPRVRRGRTGSAGPPGGWAPSWSRPSMPATSQPRSGPCKP